VKHRAAQNRIGFAKIQAIAEIVRADPLVPIASKVRRVAVLFGGDNEFEIPELGARAARRDRGAIGAGRRFPANRVLAIDERDSRAGNRRTIVQTCDEDQRVFADCP
jgi:hypothetical protein